MPGEAGRGGRARSAGKRSSAGKPLPRGMLGSVVRPAGPRRAASPPLPAAGPDASWAGPGASLPAPPPPLRGKVDMLWGWVGAAGGGPAPPPPPRRRGSPCGPGFHLRAQEGRARPLLPGHGPRHSAGPALPSQAGPLLSTGRQSPSSRPTQQSLLPSRGRAFINTVRVQLCQQPDRQPFL